MNILVTGANGLIGKVLVNALLDEGHHVTAQIRREENRVFGERADIKYVVITNICSETDWECALKNIDVVIHTAAYVHTTKHAMGFENECYEINTYATEKLATDSVRAGVGKFVFLSSITVHGLQPDSSDCVNEETEIFPQSVYADSKYQAEQILNKFSNDIMQTVIIRPPLTYGPGIKANFLGLVKLVDSGLPLPLNAIRNRRSFISVWNLVDFILLCISNSKANNQTFVVSDNYDLSTPALIRKIAKHLGKRARLFYVPVWLLRAAAGVTGRTGAIERLQGNLCINTEKAHSLLGWHPPVGFDEGLQKTLQWYKASKQDLSG